MSSTGSRRNFVFLQGPHGPFLAQLASALRKAGADAWRVGFNAGDRAFWGRQPGYIPYVGRIEDWPAALDDLLDRHQITDILLYGDARPVHEAAANAARARGLRLHVLEEGYLRPYWVSYERGGSNGNSPLVSLPLAEIRRRVANLETVPVEAPDHWGTLPSHVFYGALYHFFVLAANRRYRNMRSHRAISVAREFRLQLRKLLLMPFTTAARVRATARIFRGRYPYHLVLLQLEHDANFLTHSPFDSQAEFVTCVTEGFARGAPPHHHLVFKAHPLEDGRVPLRRIVSAEAQQSGIGGRVHFVGGGKLARLLDHALGAVTVNSTAGHQVLWRGLPLKAFGRSVYSQPEFVSNQPLDKFFEDPASPDLGAYLDYRAYLLGSSQLPGSFYTARGRMQVIRRLVDNVLDPNDPYEHTARSGGRAAPPQHLGIV